MSNKKGFTLVELLGTIVVLGIIMGIAIPAVSNYLFNSKTQALETMAKTSYEAAHTQLAGMTSQSNIIFSIQDLAKDGFMDKPYSPYNKTELCEGIVMAKEQKTSDNSSLDSYTYGVVINCNPKGTGTANKKMVIKRRFQSDGKVDDNINEFNSDSYFTGDINRIMLNTKD